MAERPTELETLTYTWNLGQVSIEKAGEILANRIRVYENEGDAKVTGWALRCPNRVTGLFLDITLQFPLVDTPRPAADTPMVPVAETRAPWDPRVTLVFESMRLAGLQAFWGETVDGVTPVLIPADQTERLAALRRAVPGRYEMEY